MDHADDLSRDAATTVSVITSWLRFVIVPPPLRAGCDVEQPIETVAMGAMPEHVPVIASAIKIDCISDLRNKLLSRHEDVSRTATR